MRLWDAKSGKEIQVLTGHDEEINAIAFTGDGKRLLSSARDGLVKVWDFSLGLEIYTLRDIGTEAQTLSMTKDGQ